jgi:hypothetical protein
VSTLLTATSLKGVTALTVADESDFTALDWIKVSASKDIYTEWATRTLPRELNQVVSTSANTINLRYPLSRDYTYAVGQTDKPIVELYDVVKDNIVIENINIQGEIVFNAAKNISLSNISAERVKSTDAIRFFKLDNVKAEQDVSTSDADGLICLQNATEGTISVQTYGSGNGVMLWGCAKVSGSVVAKQHHWRAVWLYGCDDVHLSPVNVTGTKTNAINFEILLFDYSGSCSIRNAFVKEVNKTGNANVLEYRKNFGLCEFTDSVFYSYMT